MNEEWMHSKVGDRAFCLIPSLDHASSFVWYRYVVEVAYVNKDEGLYEVRLADVSVPFPFPPEKCPKDLCPKHTRLVNDQGEFVAFQVPWNFVGKPFRDWEKKQHFVKFFASFLPFLHYQRDGLLSPDSLQSSTCIVYNANGSRIGRRNSYAKIVFCFFCVSISNSYDDEPWILVKILSDEFLTTKFSDHHYLLKDVCQTNVYPPNVVSLKSLLGQMGEKNEWSIISDFSTQNPNFRDVLFFYVSKWGLKRSKTQRTGKPRIRLELELNHNFMKVVPWEDWWCPIEGEVFFANTDGWLVSVSGSNLHEQFWDIGAEANCVCALDTFITAITSESPISNQDVEECKAMGKDTALSNLLKGCIDENAKNAHVCWIKRIHNM